MSARYDYSEWDGTQEFTDLDPDDLLAGLTDDLLAGGDLDDALRRALRTGEPAAVPRISDLGSLVPSTQGKIEVEAMEEGHEEEVVAHLVAAATLAVFRRRVTLDNPGEIVAAFTEQVVVHAGDDLPSASYLAVLADIPELEPPTRALAGPDADAAESPALMASALEFLLEGLHLTKRLNKDASGARALYRGRK